MTPEVAALRDRLDLPGIRVLQFGFDWDEAEVHLPHNFPQRSLAMTGTHDNDTTAGWYAAIAEPGTRDWVHRYLKTDGRDIHWTMIRAVLESRADTAVIPAQDLLGLGGEARMNRPGVALGNWIWRLAPGQLGSDALGHLGNLAAATGRIRPIVA